MTMRLFLIINLLLASMDFTSGNYIVGACVDGASYESDDYFPDKVEIEYATLFTVTYFNTYKIVTNLLANTTYYLYQCGTDIPDVPDDADLVVSVPVINVAIGDTTFITRIEQLNERLSLKAYTGFTDYITSPCVNQLLSDGLIVEAYSDDASCGTSVDNTALELAEIDVTFATDPYTCAYDATSDLILNAVVVSDFYEESYLATAEWIKFFALFYNRESSANLVFDGIDERFTCTEQNAQTCSTVLASPKVLWSPLWTDEYGWKNNIAGAYYDIAIEAAGGEMIVCDGGTVSSAYGGLYMTNEEFLACNLEAEVCIFAYDFEEVYANATNKAVLDELDCVQEGRVYDNQGNGPFDWFESRLGNPDVLLEDLVMCIHDESTLFGIGFHDRVWLRKPLVPETALNDGVCDSVNETYVSLANECIDVVSSECLVSQNCDDLTCAAGNPVRLALASFLAALAISTGLLFHLFQ